MCVIFVYVSLLYVRRFRFRYVLSSLVVRFFELMQISFVNFILCMVGIGYFRFVSIMVLPFFSLFRNLLMRVFISCFLLYFFISGGQYFFIILVVSFFM